MRALFVLLALCAHSALAGSSHAIIKGWTGTGRTQLILHIQDMSGDATYLKFTIDGRSFEITDADRECESVIYDKKNRVYAVSLKSSRGEFRLWMIPASLKVVRAEPGKEKWTFSAIAVGTDPRKNEPWTLSPEIELACTLEYDI